MQFNHEEDDLVQLPHQEFGNEAKASTRQWQFSINSLVTQRRSLLRMLHEHNEKAFHERGEALHVDAADKQRTPWGDAANDLMMH